MGSAIQNTKDFLQRKHLVWQRYFKVAKTWKINFQKRANPTQRSGDVILLTQVPLVGRSYSDNSKLFSVQLYKLSRGLRKLFFGCFYISKIISIIMDSSYFIAFYLPSIIQLSEIIFSEWNWIFKYSNYIDGLEEMMKKETF